MVALQNFSLLFSILAVMSIGWTAFSKITSFGGLSNCRLLLPMAQSDHRMLRQKMDRLDLDVINLTYTISQSERAAKYDKNEYNDNDLPVKISQLKKDNSHLEDDLKKLSKREPVLDEDAEKDRESIGRLLGENEELRGKLKILKYRLKKIIHKVKPRS